MQNNADFYQRQSHKKILAYLHSQQIDFNSAVAACESLCVAGDLLVFGYPRRVFARRLKIVLGGDSLDEPENFGAYR